MKSVLMFDTSVATLNTGDEIIMASIRKYWPEIFEENYIMTFPTHTPTFYWWQKYFKKGCRRYAAADLKFICGTNILYTDMFRPVPLWNLFITNTGIQEGAICLGTGIGINSAGTTWYTRKFFRKVLSKEYIHSTRDEKTRKYLQDLGFQACNTGCPTMWGLTPELCRTIPSQKAQKVVFTLTHYQAQPENDRKMIEILRKNYGTVYFWAQSLGDLDYLKTLCPAEEIEMIAPNLQSFDRLLNEEIDYVGTRLHGGIFAMQHQCRTVIISIDHRAREMAHDYSFPCIERNQIDRELEQMINSEWHTEISGLDFEKIAEWKRQFI